MSRHARTRRLCSQLLRASSASLPSAAQPCAVQGARCPQAVNITSHQSRSYAAPRAPRAGPSYAEVYDLSSITPLMFRDVIWLTGGSFDSLSPEQYHEAAARFADAIKKGASPWSVKLTGENAIPVNVLHELGCIMRLVPKPQTPQAFAVAMWASASEMGYRPSTLSLSRELVRSHAWGRKPQLRKVETRFKQLVSEGKDRDALTVEGEMLYELGRYDAAAKMLERALRLEDSDFEWKPHCQLCLGRSYLKLGKTAEARGIFEAMVGSGSAEADIELAEMLRTSEPEKAEQHLYVAAVNGRVDMFRQLSEIEFERGAKAADRESKKKHHLWAMEWSRLGDLREKF